MHAFFKNDPFYHLRKSSLEQIIKISGTIHMPLFLINCSVIGHKLDNDQKKKYKTFSRNKGSTSTQRG